MSDFVPEIPHNRDSQNKNINSEFLVAAKDTAESMLSPKM